MILDHGASVTDTQLQIAKDAARVILSAIDEHDKVTGTPSDPRGIGSSLNVFCEVPCVLWYTVLNPYLKRLWGKESGFIFILAFEDAAADSGSKSLLKTTPTKLSLVLPSWLLSRLPISCDFHTGSYAKEEKDKGVEAGGWLDFSSRFMRGEG